MSLDWKKYSMLQALGPATTSVGEYVAPALPKNFAPSEYIGSSLNACSHPVCPSMMKPRFSMKCPPSEVSLMPTVRDASAIHCRWSRRGWAYCLIDTAPQSAILRTMASASPGLVISLAREASPAVMLSPC